jgi:hypothetical protein
MKTLFAYVLFAAMFPFALLGFSVTLAWGGFKWGTTVAEDIADDLSIHLAGE